MDPTRQNCQPPSKAVVDTAVRLLTTYFFPALMATIQLLVIHNFGLDPLTAIVLGTFTFWLTALDAVGIYFRTIVIPRAIAISGDPPFADYMRFIEDRLFASAIITACITAAAIVAPRAIEVHALITGTVCSLAILGLVWTRAAVATENNGKPRLASGSVGNRLLTHSIVAPLANKIWPKANQRIRWGGIDLGIGELIKNFLFVGSVGSGKTLVLKQWLLDVLPYVYQFKQWRALIVDPKSEFYPWLIEVLPSYFVKLLSPTDERTHYWDINRDLDSPESIFEASNILIPKAEKESQPYFSNAARRLLYATMLSLHLQAPTGWQLSDVIFAIQSRRRMETLLRIHQESREILANYATNERVFADVFSTLDAAMQNLLPLASNWSHLIREAPHRRISLKEWTNGNYVLLLGKRAANDTAESALIGILMKRATQLLLDGPTGQSTLDMSIARRTIIAIDEAPRAGHLDILTLATNGRDYGIALATSLQSVESMRAIFSNTSEFDAFANEFHSAVFLHSNGPETAKWMSERIGRIEQLRRHADGQPETVWQPTVDPTVFQTLGQGQAIGPHRVPAVYLNSTLGTWYHAGPIDVSPSRAGTPGRLPASPRHFRVWDDADLVRLNLTSIRDQLDLDDEKSSPSTTRTTSPHPPGGIRPSIRRFRL